MLSVWILTVSSLFIYPAFVFSASNLGSPTDENVSYNYPSPQYHDRVRWLAKERPEHSYADPLYFPSAATYSEINANHLHNAKVVRRSPVRFPTLRKKPDAKAALGRVKTGMGKDSDDAVKDINNAHTQAMQDIEKGVDEEKKADKQMKEAIVDLKAHPNDEGRKFKAFLAAKNGAGAFKEGEALKHNAATNEQNTDINVIKGFGQKATDLQKSEFNTDGTPKSDAQKAADQALAGFLKFLSIFSDVLSGICMLFPGPGDLISMGIRLLKVGEEVAKTVANVAKAVKGVEHAVKAAEDIRKVMDLKPGPPTIKGVNGKKMAEMQKQLVDKLIALTAKNVQATMKKQDEVKMQDEAPKGVKITNCRRMAGPKQRC